MKTSKTMTMAIVLVITVLGMSFAFGQQAGNTSDTNMTARTVFQPTFKAEDQVLTELGDTLWGYAEEYYDRIIQMNPGLNLKKKVRGPGDVVVILPVGVYVKGVKRVPAGTVLTTPTPTPTATPTPSPSPTQKQQTDNTGGLLAILPTLFWWLMLLGALALAAYLLFVNWFNRHRRGAANAGPRFEPRGIDDRTAFAAFERQYGNGQNGQSFTVQNLRRRRASGAITVAYNNGTTQTRVLDTETVYVADLHYSDGRVLRDQLLLQACGNPLRYGNVLSYAPGIGFRFVDDRIAFIAPPTEEAGNNQQVSTNTPVQNGVVFGEGTLVIMTNGKPVEMSADDNATFARLKGEGENSQTSVEVRQNGVRLVVQDGVLKEVEAEPIRFGIVSTLRIRLTEESTSETATTTADEATGLEPEPQANRNT